MGYSFKIAESDVYPQLLHLGIEGNTNFVPGLPDLFSHTLKRLGRLDDVYLLVSINININA